MRARTIHPMFPSFRRCGVTWTREWQEVPAGMTPERVEFLESEDSAPYLEVDGGAAAASRPPARGELDVSTDPSHLPPPPAPKKR